MGALHGAKSVVVTLGCPLIFRQIEIPFNTLLSPLEGVLRDINVVGLLPKQTSRQHDDQNSSQYRSFVRRD